MAKKLLFLFFLFVSFLSHSANIYVKNGGTGNGTSWNLAYGNLQTALLNANAGDEIWVKQGTYTPSTSQNINDSFVFKDGVKIYGGFNGTEISLNSRADTTGATTFLSGDLGNGLNSRNIFKVSNANNPVNLIDGFTITKAKNQLVVNQISGGAFQILKSTLKLNNCVISDNYIKSFNYSTNIGFLYGAAAIYSDQSNLELINVDIINNTTDTEKVGVANDGIASGLMGGAIGVFLGSYKHLGGKIEGNRLLAKNMFAEGGVGVFSAVNNLVFEKLFIQDNEVRIINDPSLPIPKKPIAGAFYITNTNLNFDTLLFYNNRAITVNDGVENIFSTLAHALHLGYCSGAINNTTFGRQMIAHEPIIGLRAIRIYGGNLSLNNSVFFEQILHSYISNSSIVANRCLSKFTIPGSADTINMNNELYVVDSKSGNYTPLYCNEALDFGSLDYVSSTTDIFGNPRVVGASSDPGAIELQNPGDYNRVYVNAQNTNPLKEGISWETAFTSLQDALNCKCKDSLNVVTMPNEIWVAAGTYKVGETVEHTFKLNKGQKIYGGFNGFETLLVQRDSTLQNFQTILSGKYAEDKYAKHVVTAENTLIDTELNSVIVQEGKSLSSGTLEQMSGAGVFVRGQLSIKNSWIRNNKSNTNFIQNNNLQFHYGAGIYVYRFDDTAYGFPPMDVGLHLENVKISDNIVGGRGGAIAYEHLYFSNTNADVTNSFVSKFKNIEITNNKAVREDGQITSSGAMFFNGQFNVDMEDFVISNNEATLVPALGFTNTQGTVINLKRGKIINNKELSTTTPFYDGTLLSFNSDNEGSFGNINFESVLIADNELRGPLFQSKWNNIKLTNTTIAGNTSQLRGNFFFIQGTNVKLQNSIISLATNNLQDIFIESNNYNITIQNSLYTKPIPTQFVNLGSNFNNLNPFFINPANGNYFLQSNSLAVNSGNNSFLNLSPDFDAIRNPRIVGGIVDMGALEYSPTASIHEFNKEKQFTVYPNPAENEVFLQFDKYQKGSLAIYDLTGKQVLSLNQIEVQENELFRINTENFASGTYIINWKGTDFNTSIKLIKK